MKIYNYTSVLQEVPGELSLCFNVYGCKNNCKNCSWKNTTLTPYEISLKDYEKILKYDNNLSSCVCFMGGEWNSDLIDYLKLARKKGYKTCLYTGSNQINTDILSNLDFIKVGRYIEELGGLNSQNTNQHFLTLGDKTKCFQKSK